MHASSECAALVKAWEGLRDGDPATVNLDPYMDPVGIWTIGYGRALRDPVSGKYLRGAADRARASAQYPAGVTRARAEIMLDEDLHAIDAPVTALVRSDTRQPQFDALLSFQFNLGALSTSTLRKLHQNNMPAGAVPDDLHIRTLMTRVRDKTIGTPQSVIEGFGVFSFSNKAFFGGLFCRRLAEWRLYAGGSAAVANSFGNHVRSVIAG